MRYLLTFILCLFGVPAFAEHWGDQPDGGSLYFLFSTVGTTGAPITIGGTADCEVYKDNSDTQLAASIAEDVDSITGLHRITIDTTVSSYDAGSLYTVVISVGTADSISLVGRTVGSFYLTPAQAVTGLRNGNVTHVAGTTQTGIDLSTILSDINGVASSTNAIVSSITHGNAALKTLIDTIDDLLDTEMPAVTTKLSFLPSITAGSSGGLFIAGSNAATTVNFTGTVSGNSTHSAADAATAVWAAGTRTITGGTIGTYTGNTPQTGDGYSILNSGVFGLAIIEAQTDDIGAAGAGLTVLATQASVTAGFAATLQAEIEYTLTTTAVREAGGDPEVRTITVEYSD